MGGQDDGVRKTSVSTLHHDAETAGANGHNGAWGPLASPVCINGGAGGVPGEAKALSLPRGRDNLRGAGGCIQCQALPVEAGLAAGLGDGHGGPFLKEARESEQGIGRHPRKERGFIGLSHDQGVCLRFRRFIQALEQQARLEIREPCRHRRSTGVFWFIGQHIMRWPERPTALCQSCEGNANIG